MARNCEKKLAGLNRLLLEKQQAENNEKHPRRPHLGSLHSAPEVKKWIPGIKKEMNYYLQQLSGVRKHDYPDYKITEFEEKVQHLERLLKRFIQKACELDPGQPGVPWQARGYTSKRKTANIDKSQVDGLPVKKISTPLLDMKEHAVCSSVNLPNRDSETKPLEFIAISAELKDKSQNERNYSESCSGPVNHYQKDIEGGTKSLLGLEYSSSDDSDSEVT